jgi:fatty-acid desaturase
LECTQSLTGYRVPLRLTRSSSFFFQGGYFFAGVLRLVFVHHGTFCVNSLAHWFGHQPFADDHTPKDHFLTGIPLYLLLLI